MAIGMTKLSDRRSFISLYSWQKAHQCMQQYSIHGSQGGFCSQQDIKLYCSILNAPLFLKILDSCFEPPLITNCNIMQSQQQPAQQVYARLICGDGIPLYKPTIVNCNKYKIYPIQSDQTANGYHQIRIFLLKMLLTQPSINIHHNHLKCIMLIRWQNISCSMKLIALAQLAGCILLLVHNNN